MNPIIPTWAPARYSLLFLCTVIAAPIFAADDQARHFDQGRAQVFITAGTGYAFDEDYLVIGAGLTYFLSNGLGIGLSVESWTSGDPGLTKVEPSLQYVFVQSGAVKPYVGAFFNQTYIEGLEDLQSVGARGGVYISAGPRAFIGAGAAYESYLDCEETIFRSCDDVYPEFSFVIGF